MKCGTFLQPTWRRGSTFQCQHLPTAGCAPGDVAEATPSSTVPLYLLFPMISNCGKIHAEQALPSQTQVKFTAQVLHGILLPCIRSREHCPLGKLKLHTHQIQFPSPKSLANPGPLAVCEILTLICRSWVSRSGVMHFLSFVAAYFPDFINLGL